MKIINAMFGRGQGGIEQALVDYCEALRASGHEPVAIIHPDAAIKAALEARNISFHELSNWGAWDPFAITKLRALLNRLSPDACIAHGNRAVSLLLRAARERKIVGVMHNYKIKTAGLSAIFYPTKDLLQHVNRQDMSGKQLYLVPNMVRVPAQTQKRQWHTPPVIGAMGRLVAKKGFDVFIDALALLKSRDVQFKAVLAGQGEEMQALRKLAADKGLSDILHFSGWEEHAQHFFDAINLFCLPSHHEPFGIVLLEAMAQALPIVAAASEGPSEILTNGTDGVLVGKADAGALAEALFALLHSQAYAEQLGRKAYDSVKTRYDLPVVAAKLDLALRTLCRV